VIAANDPVGSAAAMKAAGRRFDFWGVPFDGAATLGWPGSRYGPDGIRNALSWMAMRVRDGAIYSVDDGRVLALDDDFFIDRGDVRVVAHDAMASLDACAGAVSVTVSDGRVPIVVGGDDSLLYGCVRGFHDAVDGSVGIVHFDAHLDLMDESESQGRFSHSSGMRRALELPRVSPEHSIQVAVRNFNFPASRSFIDEIRIPQLPAAEFERIGIDNALERIAAAVSPAQHVFWSFDIDAVDPAYAPGAGAHDPGGLTSRQAIDCVRRLAPLCDGFALMEVNPMTDVGDMTSILAAHLVYNFAVFGHHRR
jgi:agmatinase